MTYSRLDLGEGYRYNYRQSNPNIRDDLESLDSNFRGTRNRTKSAPASRATTPTRLRSRNRDLLREARMNLNGNGNGNPEPPSSASDFPSPPSTITNYFSYNTNQPPAHPAATSTSSYRPATGTSLYSQETTFSGYHPEEVSSIDTRSLGRDSALDPYMSSGYRFGQDPYSGNQMYNMTSTPDRPNPFVHGSSVATEADNVVSMFLMNMNRPQDGQPGQFQSPGKIEDLSSPISVGAYQQPTTARTPSGAAGTREVISKLRKEFLEGTASAATTTAADEQQYSVVNKKKNKYLSPDQKWQKPNPTGAQDQGSVVQAFVAPQMHHAEVVHLRQDSSSDESLTATGSQVEALSSSLPMNQRSPDAIVGRQNNLLLKMISMTGSNPRPRRRTGISKMLPTATT